MFKHVSLGYSLKVKIMKRQDKKMRLNLIYLLVLTFLTGLSVNSYAQGLHQFDGSNCNAVGGDEWGTPMASDGLDPVNASSDILDFWAETDLSYFYIAFNRSSKGNSGFSFFINTDCDTLSGDTVTNGSEYAMFFSVQSGTVSSRTLFEWDPIGKQFVDSGKTFDALLGEAVCGDNTTTEEFFEMRITFDLIFDLCDTLGSSCGNITVEVGSTTAGGSPNSALKDRFTVNLPLPVNLPPVALFTLSDTIACSGELITMNASSSLHGNISLGNEDSIIAFEWDLSYDGTTFNIENTDSVSTNIFSANASNLIALRVRDQYGCTSIDTSTVNSYVLPQANMVIDNTVAPAPNCTDIGYNGKSSLDNNGTSNLNYQWDFGDGGTSILDSGGYIYPECNTYTIQLIVEDPDNHQKCAFDTNNLGLALPVNLTHLSAILSGKNLVDISWSTASEYKNLGWEVLRSKDGVNWEVLGMVYGKGSSSSKMSYSYVDKMPLAVNYYKLKQIDFNGEYEYTKIVSVLLNNLSISKAVIYPNPAGDNVFIDPGYKDVQTNYVLYNASGQLISSIKSMAGETIKLSLASLPVGVYVIRITHENGEVINRQKFIKYR